MNSEAINEIAAALAKAQGQMNNAKYNRRNPYYGNEYADLAAITDTVRKPLSDNGICYTQIVENNVLFTKLIHASGQWLGTAYPLPDTFDKPQAMGSALTYARRYSLAALCGISAEEDDDAELASKKNGAATADKEPTPISPHQLQEMADLMDSVGADVQKFLDYANVLRLADISTTNYDGLMDTLREKGKRGPK